MLLLLRRSHEYTIRPMQRYKYTENDAAAASTSSFWSFAISVSVSLIRADIPRRCNGVAISFPVNVLKDSSLNPIWKTPLPKIPHHLATIWSRFLQLFTLTRITFDVWLITLYCTRPRRRGTADPLGWRKNLKRPSTVHTVQSTHSVMGAQFHSTDKSSTSDAHIPYGAQRRDWHWLEGMTTGKERE